MAYCPKCGVQVDDQVRECALCHFSLPEMTPDQEGYDFDKQPPLRFPRPEQIYRKSWKDIKKRTFFALTTFIFINLSLVIVNQIMKGKIGFFTSFLIMITLSFLFYLFIFFGGIRNKRVMIFSLIFNTFVFTFLLDLSNGLKWFIPVFVPATILASLLLIITASIIRNKKKRTINLILLIAVVFSFFLIGLEIITDSFLQKKITLSWSLFLGLEIIGLALILLFYYHQLFTWMINKLKKKLHI